MPHDQRYEVWLNGTHKGLREGKSNAWHDWRLAPVVRGMLVVGLFRGHGGGGRIVG
jgi:hypothetical protein